LDARQVEVDVVPAGAGSESIASCDSDEEIVDGGFRTYDAQATVCCFLTDSFGHLLIICQNHWL